MSIQNTIERVQINQNWNSYSPIEHETWAKLYNRQIEILKDIACEEFLHGINILNLNDGGIPDFDKINPLLFEKTGWKIIAVEGLVEDEDFFELLANRIFPAGQFIRKPEQFDYISEPDIFHDVFGHVPLLTNPIFADYMEAYGKGGMRAIEFNSLKELARLYWYSVEFGLISQNDQLKIYGAGILSSPLESVYSVQSHEPIRIKFDLLRLMKTEYQIDRLQENYFVIESFQELFDATLQDFAKIYETLRPLEVHAPKIILPDDKIYHI